MASNSQRPRTTFGAVAVPLLCLLSLFTALAQEPQLPPLRKVGNLWGITAETTVVLAGEGAQRFELTTSYMFPGRSRWWINAEGSTQRVLQYGYGRKAYRLLPGSSESQELEGAERLAALREFELRRALFAWPLAFEWEGSGTERRASLGELGSLTARVPQGAERPTQFSSSDADGNAYERIDQVEWGEIDDRTWPTKWRRAIGGNVVWTETLDKVDTKRALDEHFLPPDRRPEKGRPTRVGGAIRGRLPEAVFLREELPAKLDWQAALDLARRRLRREREKHPGLDLDDAAVIELDRSGRPLATQLVLTHGTPGPDARWTTRPAGEAWSQIFEDVRAAEQAGVSGLVRRAGDRAGTILVRTAREGAEPRARAQLSVLLTPQ